jgi:hypothetical protein
MPALTTFGRGLYAYVDKVTTRANVDDWAVVFSVDKEDEQNKAKLCIVSSEDKAKVISAYVSAPSYDASATRPDDVVAALDGCEWLAEVAKPSTHTLTSKWASLFKPAGTGTIVVTIGEDSGDAARTLVGKTFIAEGMPIVIGNVFMGMYSGEAKVTGASISGERVTIEFDRNGETFNIDVSTPIVRAAVDRGNVITIDVSGSIATSLAVQLVKALPKSGNVNGASKLAISDVAEVAAAAGIAHTLSESTQENLRDGMAMMLVQQLAALLEKDGMAARTWPNTSASRLGKTISEITGTGTFVTGSTGNKGTGTAAPQFPRLEALKGKLKTTSDFEDMVNKLIGVACKGPSAEVAKTSMHVACGMLESYLKARKDLASVSTINALSDDQSIDQLLLFVCELDEVCTPMATTSAGGVGAAGTNGAFRINLHPPDLSGEEEERRVRTALRGDADLIESDKDARQRLTAYVGLTDHANCAALHSAVESEPSVALKRLITSGADIEKAMAGTFRPPHTLRPSHTP